MSGEDAGHGWPSVRLPTWVLFMFDAVLYIGVRPERKKRPLLQNRTFTPPPLCKVGRWWIVAVGGHFPRREINAHSRFAGAHTQPFNIAVRGRDGVSPPCLVEESSGRYFRSGRERSPFRVVNRGNSNRKMRPPTGRRTALACRAWGRRREGGGQLAWAFVGTLGTV